MAKLYVENHNVVWIRYPCPGCKHDHTVPAERWHWNGDVDKPTLSPSVRHYYHHPDDNREITICHYRIKNGVIEFCDDCQHKLRGQSVPMVEVAANKPPLGT